MNVVFATHFRFKDSTLPGDATYADAFEKAQEVLGYEHVHGLIWYRKNNPKNPKYITNDSTVFHPGDGDIFLLEHMLCVWVWHEACEPPLVIHAWGDQVSDQLHNPGIFPYGKAYDRKGNEQAITDDYLGTVLQLHALPLDERGIPGEYPYPGPSVCPCDRYNADLLCPAS